MAKPKYPFGVIPIFIAVYASNAVYQNFFSNYLHSLSIGNQTIGTIMALSPVMAFIAQPIWGAAGDRMRYKNTLVRLLSLASCGVMLLVGVNHNVFYVGAMVGAYAFFQTSLVPLLDTIALETLERGGYAYGPIRMTGSITLALISPIAGMVLANRYALAPLLTALFLALGFLASFPLPKVEGRQHRGNKVSMLVLLRNRELTFMTLFTMLLMVGMSVFYTFFSLHLQEMGATSTMIGWAFFIGSLSEVPFLLFSDRIFKRLGVGRLLMLAAAAICIRLFLLSFLQNAYLVLATQIFHGWGYIVMVFTMAKYVNLVTPPELKASGQMLLNVIGLGIARALGAFIGGRVAGALGIRTLFFAAGCVVAAALLFFGASILRSKTLSAAGRQG